MNHGPFKIVLAATRSSFTALKHLANTASATVGAGTPCLGVDGRPLPRSFLTGSIQHDINKRLSCDGVSLL